MSAAPLWMALIAWAAALGGFVALSLAMERHFGDVTGRDAAACQRWQGRLRLGGALCLLLSLLVCLHAQGMTRGWVLWLGVLTAAALTQTLALTYVWPRR